MINSLLTRSHRLFALNAAASLGVFGVLVSPAPAVFAQSAPVFSQIIVFGDSLSDDGNVRHRVESDYAVSYPGGDFNYSDGRFTNSSDTNPSSHLYAGTWHEQLAGTFLGLPRAINSLDGGFDYAFGGATTMDGSSERTVISNPFPFGGGQLSLTVDNLGRQINQYLGSFTADPNALYIIWGGGNDLFDDDTAASATAAASRVGGLVERLAAGGARNFLVPNLPPLGAVPHYADNSAKITSLDQASLNYRGQLSADLDSSEAALAAQGINVHIYRVDVWSLLVRLTAEPAKYGFTNVRDSAQGENVNPDIYLFWDDLHPTTAGHYQIAVEANRVLAGEVVSLGKALNISGRVAVGTGDNVAIGGFIVTGSDPKKVIVRGIGPSLTQYNVPNALQDPILELHDQSTGAVIAFNDNWKDTQQTEIEQSGLAPRNDAESAIVATLNPGAYTAILRGKNSGTGIGLVEVYDLDPTANSTLANISTRGFVGTGDNVIIGGFIVGNGEHPIMEVRAIGPSLMSSGVTDPLLDPTLELHDQNGTLLASDDDWRDTQESAIQASGLAPSDDRESAIATSLGPGNYTAVVRGKNNTTGVALVEVYRIE
jgi:phospholipase/lecithinase/hemolysin